MRRAAAILCVLLVGCASVLHGGAGALDAATAAARGVEDFDRAHKRELAARVILDCGSTAPGPARDACVEDRSRPLQAYLNAREPALRALERVEQAAILVRGLEQAGASVEAARLAEAIAQLTALVLELQRAWAPLRGAP